MLQKQILLIIICCIGLNGSAQTQFPTYKPLPIIPPTTFQLPQEPSFLEQYDANRRQQLEMDILKEQRDLLKGLNARKNNESKTQRYNILQTAMVNTKTGNISNVHKSKNGKLYYKSNDYVQVILPDLNFERFENIANEFEEDNLFVIQFSNSHGIAAIDYYGETNTLRLIYYRTDSDEAMIIDVTDSEVLSERATNESSYPAATPYANSKYLGKQKVFTYSPILENPNSSAKQVGRAEGEEVLVLEQTNEKYLKVKSGNIVGYLSIGWLKK